MPALNAAELKKRIKSDAPVFVLFYWKSCGHCIALRPTWEAVVNRVTGIPVAEVEYDDIGNMPGELSTIRGFPTMCIVKGNKIVDTYLGARETQPIVQFAQKYAKPPAKKAGKPKAAPKKKVGKKPA